MEDTTASTKACSRCGEIKPRSSEFHRKSSARDGRQSRCKSCQSEMAAGWYASKRPEIRAKVNADRAANRQREREYNNALRAANRERYASYQKKYRAAIKDQIAERNRRWRESCAEERRGLARRYYEANKTAAFDRSRKRRALKRGAYTEPYSRDDVWAKSAGLCGICELKILPSQGAWHVDHIVPLSLGGDDTLANTQAAHARCNLSKGNRIA